MGPRFRGGDGWVRGGDGLVRGDSGAGETGRGAGGDGCGRGGIFSVRDQGCLMEGNGLPRSGVGAR